MGIGQINSNPLSDNFRSFIDGIAQNITVSADKLRIAIVDTTDRPTSIYDANQDLLNAGTRVYQVEIDPLRLADENYQQEIENTIISIQQSIIARDQNITQGEDILGNYTVSTLEESMNQDNILASYLVGPNTYATGQTITTQNIYTNQADHKKLFGELPELL